MPGDEKWNEIYGPTPPVPLGRFPAVPRISTPRIINPTCPEHCTGKHSVDGQIMCRHCRVPAYNVVAHEWFHQEGHNWNALEPMNGSRQLNPGERIPLCQCGREMQRLWQ
mgnify:CR=1 FL=1